MREPTGSSAGRPEKTKRHLIRANTPATQAASIVRWSLTEQLHHRDAWKRSASGSAGYLLDGSKCAGHLEVRITRTTGFLLSDAQPLEVPEPGHCTLHHPAPTIEQRRPVILRPILPSERSDARNESHAPRCKGFIRRIPVTDHVPHSALRNLLLRHEAGQPLRQTPLIRLGRASLASSDRFLVP